jgi:hypothetical protein
MTLLSITPRLTGFAPLILPAGIQPRLSMTLLGSTIVDRIRFPHSSHEMAAPLQTIVASCVLSLSASDDGSGA